MNRHSTLLEIAVQVDPEAAEAVAELFNRYNPPVDWDAGSRAGEPGGGGAVIEATGFDDFGRPIPGEHRVVVKTYVRPGPGGQEILRRIQEGLAHLSAIWPVPEPTVRTIQPEDWATAWKRHFIPMRVGRRVLIVPAWEEVTPGPEDVLVRLEPGMAFGTGLHPSTRLCLAALEDYVCPGRPLLDVGTGSGILAIAGVKLGARPVVATDIDPLAVAAAQENARRNQIPEDPDVLSVQQASVPAGWTARFPLIVANILAEVLVGLLDGAYDNVPLAEPLAPGGHLVLAGILDEEEKVAQVLEATARQGLEFVERRQEEDWVALVVRRPAPS